MRTVLVADPHPLYLDAIARVVRQDSGLRLVAEEDDGRAALVGIRRLTPDVALLDSALPTLDGERVLRAVTRDELSTRVIVLTGAPHSQSYRALAAGAAGVLSKAVGADEIRRAIHCAATGGIQLCAEAQLGVACEVRSRAPDEGPLLSPREREALVLVAEGCTAPEIAHRLQIARSTVRTHIEHLYAKVGARERAELVAKAMRRGLLE